MTVEVRDNPEQSRYQLEVDGDPAGYAEYRDRGGRRIFVHTEIDDAFTGRGYGTRLAAGALDDAIGRGLNVALRCPFMRAFVARHADYRERLGG